MDIYHVNLVPHMNYSGWFDTGWFDTVWKTLGTIEIALDWKNPLWPRQLQKAEAILWHWMNVVRN